jgi:hypothetical protein
MLLIALHLTAAFKHLLISRDRVFHRMWCWPGKTMRPLPPDVAAARARGV